VHAVLSAALDLAEELDLVVAVVAVGVADAIEAVGAPLVHHRVEAIEGVEQPVGAGEVHAYGIGLDRSVAARGRRRHAIEFAVLVRGNEPTLRVDAQRHPRALGLLRHRVDLIESEPLGDPHVAGGALGGRAERLDANVLEPDRHRGTGVDLQREDSRVEPLRLGVVVDVHGRDAVDEMLEVIAPGDDDVLVPVVRLDLRSELFGRAESPRHILAAFGGPGDLLAAIGHDSPPAGAAGRVVEDARQPRPGLDVRLVAGRHEVAPVSAAVLDSGVSEAAFVVRGDPVREAKLKVIDDQVLAGRSGDQERIAPGRVLLRGPANDGAVFHGPESRPALPAGEAPAIEQLAEAVLGHEDLGRDPGDERLDDLPGDFRDVDLRGADVGDFRRGRPVEPDLVVEDLARAAERQGELGQDAGLDPERD